MRSLFFVFTFFAACAASAQGYSVQLLTEPVVARMVQGEVRFCPVNAVSGYLCKVEVNFFGKRRQQVIDWWTPETYVAAATGIQAPQVVSVDQLPNGQLALRYVAK